jgi:hypothetical protein
MYESDAYSPNFRKSYSSSFNSYKPNTYRSIFDDDEDDFFENQNNKLVKLTLEEKYKQTIHKMVQKLDKSLFKGKDLKLLNKVLFAFKDNNYIIELSDRIEQDALNGEHRNYKAIELYITETNKNIKKIEYIEQNGAYKTKIVSVDPKTTIQISFK